MIWLSEWWVVQLQIGCVRVIDWAYWFPGLCDLRDGFGLESGRPALLDKLSPLGSCEMKPIWNVTLLVSLNVGIWPWCIWKRISASLCLLWFFFTIEDLLSTDSCFKIETLLIYCSVDPALVFICTYLLLSGYVRQEKTFELSLLSKERMTNWRDRLVCVCLWENIQGRWSNHEFFHIFYALFRMLHFHKWLREKQRSGALCWPISVQAWNYPVYNV